MNAIEARELKKSFNGVVAVNGVSFSVREGEVFGFLGPNGAGKTTTIRMLVGLLKPDGGKAFIMGYDVMKNPVEARELIGVVPEEANPYPDLSAWDNLRLVGMLYALPGNEIRERGKRLLKLLGIEEVKDRKVRGFSKGMKQKLLIAMALIGGPRVLFLDEPTSGLDVFSVRKIHELISKLSREGVTVFLTTHNVEEAGAICDRVAIIDKGRIVAMGSPDELKIRTGGYLYLSVVFDREVGEDVKEILGDYEFKLGRKRLLVVCKEPGEVIGRIVDYARVKGLKIERVRTSEPSMAEVFMRIVGAK